MEYTDRIDEMITELLETRNRITPAHLPGIPDEDGAVFLRHYAEIHGRDGSVTWDGSRLVAPRATPAAPAQPAEAPSAATGQAAPPSDAATGGAKPSPVDEILAQPVGTSMLDTKPAGGAVSGWLWLLPLMFLLPGGLIAWWLARETNKTTARLMLITGIVLTVITIATGSVFRSMSEQMMQAVPK